MPPIHLLRKDKAKCGTGSQQSASPFRGASEHLCTPGRKREVEPRTSRIPVQSGASGECISVKAFPVAILDEASL